MLFYARYSLHFIKLKKWICTWWDSHYNIYSSFFFVAVTALFYVILLFFILFSFWNIKKCTGLNDFLIMIFWFHFVLTRKFKKKKKFLILFTVTFKLWMRWKWAYYKNSIIFIQIKNIHFWFFFIKKSINFCLTGQTCPQPMLPLKKV